MDSLHLFTIPKWLPDNKLPSEIWAIIFCWKWRLEMKDIFKQLPKKSKTENIGNDDYEPRQKSGNHWRKFRNHPGLWYGWYYPIDVTEKCGIELLNYKDIPIHKYGMNTFPIFCNTLTLHRHLQENLGIKCSRKLDYKSMLKLLGTV